MIGIYDDSGARLLIMYNGLSLNNPADGATSTYEVNSVQSHTSVEAVRESRPQGDGGMSALPRKTQRIIRLNGMVRATTYASLYDTAVALAAATDPGLIAFDSPTSPYLVLSFSVPTANTTDFPAGYMLCRYYALAVGTIDAPIDYGNGTVIPFHIDFHLKDPRRYSNSSYTVTGSGTATNKGDYPMYPTISIAASGAGSATFSIASSSLAGAMTLNLSGLVNTDVVTIDMDAQTVKKNGIAASSLIVGTPVWFPIEPGSNTITVTNGTNMTVTTTYRYGWCD